MSKVYLRQCIVYETEEITETAEDAEGKIYILVTRTEDSRYGKESQERYRWRLEGIAYGEDAFYVAASNLAAQIATGEKRSPEIDPDFRAPNYASPYVRALESLAEMMKHTRVLKAGDEKAKLPSPENMTTEAWALRFNTILSSSLPKGIGALDEIDTRKIKEELYPRGESTRRHAAGIKHLTERLAGRHNDYFLSQDFAHEMLWQKRYGSPVSIADALRGLHENHLPQLFVTDPRVKNLETSPEVASAHFLQIIKTAGADYHTRAMRFAIHFPEAMLKAYDSNNEDLKEGLEILASAKGRLAGSFVKKFDEVCREASVHKKETGAAERQNFENDETAKRILQDLRNIGSTPSKDLPFMEYRDKNPIEDIRQIVKTALRLNAAVITDKENAYDMREAIRRVHNKRASLENKIKETTRSIERRAKNKTARMRPTREEIEEHKQNTDNARRIISLLDETLQDINIIEARIIIDTGNGNSIPYADTLKPIKNPTSPQIDEAIKNKGGKREMEEGLEDEVLWEASEMDIAAAIEIDDVDGDLALLNEKTPQL